MAGKLCLGGSNPKNNAARFSTSKAFAEGVAYRASGTAVQRPSTNNPHQVGSDDHNAWDDGHALAGFYAGGAMPRIACLAPISNVPI